MSHLERKFGLIFFYSRNCIKGGPEDCGGVGGYADFLAAIRDPNHEEHDEYLDWIGGEFDPEKFALDEVDAGLRHVK